MDIMNDRSMSRLWILNADGSQHRKLTNREVNESSPRWSPDGSRIAFVSASDGGAEIYVYWVDTGQFAKLTQLERSPRGRAEAEPVGERGIGEIRGAGKCKV